MAQRTALFEKNVIPNNNIVSRVRRNREYLMSSVIADQLNTYRTWNTFKAFNDAYQSEYDKSSGSEDPGNPNGPAAPAVRSIFNKAGAIMTGAGHGDPSKDSTEYRVSLNVPLMDSPTARMRIRENSDCSIKSLVLGSAEGMLGKNTYSYSDFMYCKYLGRLPNTYLITLRRFPVPVDDYIGSIGLGATRREDGISSQNNVSIGCLVTWLGTPGNEMSSILKYSYKMPFKEQTADWEEATDADSASGLANSIAAAFDPTYRRHYQQGVGGQALASGIGKLWGAESGPYPASTFLDFRDKNKVYGPVDAVKSTYMRAETGLEFNQDITLTFDYELKSYNGINGRQALLDLIANILAVTYSSGTFWGGGYRGNGMHQNNIFSNLQIYKTGGGFSSFVEAFAKDYSTVTSAFRNTLESRYGGSWLSMLKGMLNQLGGMLIGGALNKLGRPARVMANSLLSPAPVGFWHVTIGNPWHPILSMGNMILKETTVEHYGPLGLDDFPTGIKVTCTLTRGKPRDSRGIEQMYMGGNERIYSSMGPKIEDMYKAAKDYKGGDTEKSEGNADTEVRASDKSKVSSSENGETVITKIQNASVDTLAHIKNMWQRHFGTADVDQVVIAASEQEYGSQPPKPKTKK